MTESLEGLKRRLDAAIRPGFRDRLLDKGLARGMIWTDGILPAGAPAFAKTLSDDLLDYGYAVFSIALQLRDQAPDDSSLERAFLVAGESIEASVLKAAKDRESGFHQVSAAVAFHLAKYSARAYSVLPTAEGSNLAPNEKALVQLVRRSLDQMRLLYSSWLLEGDHEDQTIADRLRADEDFNVSDACHIILTSSFMRSLSLLDHAILTGESESAARSKAQMTATAEAALDLDSVSQWWTATLAVHLIDELWKLTLYQQIPQLPQGDIDAERWNQLRFSYIHCLRRRNRSAIELWPSQLEAAHRAIDHEDNLVIALPTSAGKTRIAELCILRELASNHRIIYVTPLRALSAQVERDLADVFLPLGYSVSSLYGSAGISCGDEELLREGTIVVSTPEKLDFALRNDESVLNGVGLIVLDEGHMLGPNEREVRYEALVQRLLLLGLTKKYRVICLSAMFPSPEEMNDLVAWIRQDKAGSPVHSLWRPTRQRFGVIRWVSGSGRLDIEVEKEHPFVPHFIECVNPPVGSRRRNVFPSNKNELALAAAWRFATQGKDVLVYCPLRISVEALGKLILKNIDIKVLPTLRNKNKRILDAMAMGTEWLGADHPAVRCLEYGVALHHGGLPRPFLGEVEHLLKSGDCPVIIASPTLAQGLNLAASVLIVPSIWRNKNIIPSTEFANIAGRAGRAFVDVEGLVLHVIREKIKRKSDLALTNWLKLVKEAKAPLVQSGILKLAIIIYDRIAKTNNVSTNELVDYVTGNSDAWNFKQPATGLNFTHEDWDRDVASLDSAILALLSAETETTDLADSLTTVLASSLFTRQLLAYEEAIRKLIRGVVMARANYIWSATVVSQRKGYYAAGVGLQAGQFIDANLASLVHFLGEAELALSLNDSEAFATAVVAFAELILITPPFRAPKELPLKWQDALSAWVRGDSSAEVVAICDDNGVDLLQEALKYRLPWAMEAVRVHAHAVAYEGSSDLTGSAALAVDAGSSNRSAILLLRSGMASREGASAAVESTDATFIDREGMHRWLKSSLLRERTTDERWPTELSHPAWLKFYENAARKTDTKWTRSTQHASAEWIGKLPEMGTSVIIEPKEIGSNILSPGYIILGNIISPLLHNYCDIVAARVGENSEDIVIEYYGPAQIE